MENNHSNHIHDAPTSASAQCGAPPELRQRFSALYTQGGSASSITLAPKEDNSPYTEIKSQQAALLAYSHKYNVCICHASAGDNIGGDRTTEGNRRVYIRYALMLVHSAMTISSLAIALHRRDVVQTTLVGMMAIAFVVYVPAALALCLVKKATRFDHVAGEVAYLIVQIAGYLGAGLYPTITLSFTDCTFVWDRFNNGQPNGASDNSKWCATLRYNAALGYVHSGVVAVWLIWLIVMALRIGARKRGGPGVGRAMQVSTGWLLSGWPVSAGERAKPC